jgi:hypothetical protein
MDRNIALLSAAAGRGAIIPAAHSSFTAAMTIPARTNTTIRICV